MESIPNHALIGAAGAHDVVAHDPHGQAPANAHTGAKGAPGPSTGAAAAGSLRLSSLHALLAAATQMEAPANEKVGQPAAVQKGEEKAGVGTAVTSTDATVEEAKAGCSYFVVPRHRPELKPHSLELVVRRIPRKPQEAEGGKSLPQQSTGSAAAAAEPTSATPMAVEEEEVEGWALAIKMADKRVEKRTNVTVVLSRVCLLPVPVPSGTPALVIRAARATVGDSAIGVTPIPIHGDTDDLSDVVHAEAARLPEDPPPPEAASPAGERPRHYRVRKRKKKNTGHRKVGKAALAALLLGNFKDSGSGEGQQGAGATKSSEGSASDDEEPNTDDDAEEEHEEEEGADVQERKRARPPPLEQTSAPEPVPAPSAASDASIQPAATPATVVASPKAAAIVESAPH